MAGRYPSIPKQSASSMEDALEALSAEDLRELILELIPWLDERNHARLANAIVDRAARSASGWTPSRPSDEGVSEIVSFAEAAKRIGRADPSEVDDYLRQGSNAFLGKDYRASLQIFRALLAPISEAEIDLGQHEMVDEVLGVDVADCAAQYVVAVYMTSAPAERAKAVRQAIDEVHGLGHFWEPLREMERVAIEPLPALDEFLPEWRALIEASSAEERQTDWDTDADRWRREVVQRMEGAAGLAAVARKTKRADDLRAWCRALAETKDWKAALPACIEAAEIVADKTYSRGEFLDGAALAAQQLGRKDLPAWLERAWREDPSLMRLRRWLGTASGKTALKKRAAEALEACPTKASRQRAFLHVLLGELESAAKLLAAAPGLGWSNGEHPGHLVFPVFQALLGGSALPLAGGRDAALMRGMAIDELELVTIAPDERGLRAPEVDAILKLGGVTTPVDSKARKAMLLAMRKAAEKRLAGVTENKRRRHYGHAAELALTCAALDSTPEGARWLAGIRDAYRRYPALQSELARKRGRA